MAKEEKKEQMKKQHSEAFHELKLKLQDYLSLKRPCNIFHTYLRK